MEREKPKGLPKSPEQGVIWAVGMLRQANPPPDRVAFYQDQLKSLSTDPKVKADIEFLQGLPDKEFGARWNKAFINYIKRGT